ncbi:MAG TPA: response regulator [Nitrospirota bacterium]|nr:response regulator [Nitrospirota bacterium]
MPALDDNRNPHHPARRSRFILVVDNDEKNLAYLSRVLLRFNYQFLSAGSGEEAIELASIIVPCLVIVSWNIPEITGPELIHRLSSNTATNHIPLVGLLTTESAEDKRRCFDCGAIGYLCRPIDAETLYRTIQIAVEKNPRTGMRVRTIQPVRFEHGDTEGLRGAHTLDLSTHGMFLRTTHLPSVHTQIGLQFDLSGRTISTKAVVLYSCTHNEGPYREPGIGLRFLDIEPKDQEHIRQFIRADIMRGAGPAAS